MTGSDSARVIVFDYTAGDTMGFGASLSGARESEPILCALGDVQGTTWVNEDFLLAFSSTGEIFAVDPATMASFLVATVDVGLADPCGQGFTDIEFNPFIVAPVPLVVVYAMYGGFSDGVTTNKLAVLGPAEDGLIVLETLDYSSSMDTTREIALGSDGNLFVSQFGGAIDVIPDADDLASLSDNNSIDWYTSSTFAAFSGIDVALEMIEFVPEFEPGTSEAPLTLPIGCRNDTGCTGCTRCPSSAIGLGGVETAARGAKHDSVTLFSLDMNMAGGGEVYGFSGEYTLSGFDLGIPGRCLGTTIGRKYRSRVPTSSAQGNGWDHAYNNIRVEADGDSRTVFDGNTRRDTYAPAGDGTWTRPEFFRVLTEDAVDGSLTLTFPDTGEWRFLPLDDLVAPGRISGIVDRNGNALTFEYLSSPGGSTTRITDDLGRQTDLLFDEDGRLEKVSDFSGREIEYAYYQDGEEGGCPGDLKSVRSPLVTGTPNGNDYPEGKTTTYTYTCGFLTEPLNHDLLTITDPKGQTYLTNVYSISRPLKTADSKKSATSADARSSTPTIRTEKRVDARVTSSQSGRPSSPARRTATTTPRARRRRTRTPAAS